ncbi:MAG: DNA/RNA non-specific endonuclease [Pseudomonadota bacterium]
MCQKLLAALVIITSLSIPAHASSSACPTHYLNNDAPEITDETIASKAREICFLSFGVMHSGITRTPLWSAEHLTRDSVENAKEIERVNRFHAEDSLPMDERAELKDYARSGFDRGHMAPSGDMPNRESQAESFSLANMVPQNPKNNRYLWEGIESAVRRLAIKRGELFVLTGPLFEGDKLQQLNGHVMVPTHFYKIIYDPKRGEAAAYLVENNARHEYSTVSVAELEKLAGINFFPSLPSKKKQAKLDLPEPTPHGGRSLENTQLSLYREIDKILHTLRAMLR